MKSTIAKTLAGAAMLAVSGCAENPPLADPDWTALEFVRDARSKQKEEIEVSVAVPDPAQVRALFGLPLAEAAVQPLWLRIRNNEDRPYWFVPVGTDPDYFSAHEVAWRLTSATSATARDAIAERLLRMQVHTLVRPGEAISGFLYVHRREGMLPVNVDLISYGDRRSFDFIVPVAGIVPDFKRVDFEALYEPQEMVAIADHEALREWLSNLPCCASGKGGDGGGDPLNFVLVGERDQVISAFVRRGWNVTEATDSESIARLVDAYLSGKPYPYAPVSPLYVFGRRHDIALQKARATVHGRNHLRLWFAPAFFRGQPIVIGQVSRDVGIRYTGRLDPPTTHVIDPMVDDARYYLMQDLALSQAVRQVGFVEGSRYAPPHDPAQNLLGDPYYSDGLRGVLILGDQPVSFEEIRPLDWSLPGILVAPDEAN